MSYESITHGDQKVEGDEQVDGDQQIDGNETIKGDQTVEGDSTVQGKQSFEGGQENPPELVDYREFSDEASFSYDLENLERSRDVDYRIEVRRFSAAGGSSDDARELQLSVDGVGNSHHYLIEDQDGNVSKEEDESEWVLIRDDDAGNVDMVRGEWTLCLGGWTSIFGNGSLGRRGRVQVLTRGQGESSVDDPVGITISTDEQVGSEEVNATIAVFEVENRSEM